MAVKNPPARTLRDTDRPLGPNAEVFAKRNIAVAVDDRGQAVLVRPDSVVIATDDADAVRGRAKRIDKPGQVFNRIHVADIAQAIDAAFAHKTDGIFNVTDDEPAPYADQVLLAAKLLDIDPPKELSMEEAQKILTPMALSFYAGCVRVKNDKLKCALGVKLRYPTYREGLRALFDGGYEARDPLTAPR